MLSSKLAPQAFDTSKPKAGLAQYPGPTNDSGLKQCCLVLLFDQF
jgi:hypothetical protein